MFSRSALDNQISDWCRRALCESCKDKCTKLSGPAGEKSPPPGGSVPPSFQPYSEVPTEWLARDKHSEPPAKPECTAQVERWASPETAPIAYKGLEIKDAKKRASILNVCASPVPVGRRLVTF